jgi:hypothetical protein
MPAVNTIESALATKRRALDREDFVRSIANELQPWSCPKSEVLAKVRKAIDELREDLAQPPAIGFRSENRQTARDCIAVLDNAKKRLTRLPPTFIASLARATYFDETLVIRGAEDWVGLCRRRDEETEKLQKDCAELLERMDRFAEQCKQFILAPVRLGDPGEPPCDSDPTGAISKTSYWKERAAIFAVSLITEVSAKKPAAGDRNTSFCVIASQLFEVVTGERDPNLLRACKDVLAQLRSIHALGISRLLLPD